MSPRNFARAFAAQAGCTPARFVEQTRVAAAARLLRRTRWTQERIASRSGFGSVDALQRAFARQHGLTPQAWRDGEGGRAPRGEMDRPAALALAAPGGRGARQGLTPVAQAGIARRSIAHIDATVLCAYPTKVPAC